MSAGIQRRGFLSRMAASAGALYLGAGGSWALQAPGREDEAWAFPLLGDLHFDRTEHHDEQWLQKTYPNDVAQVRNYVRISRDITPKLLAEVRKQTIASRLPVSFIVQLGDLIEGLCGSEVLAARQASDALALIQDARFPVPFLFTKGNHDITGPGADSVYDRLLVPFLSAQEDQEIKGAAFSRRRGGTLLVFFDAYNRDSLDWFSELLKAQQPRRLIFVIHPPVVPFNARSSWHVYSSPRQQPQRERLLALLGGARAVVLCGHLHKYSFLVRRTERGRFAQLAISSVGGSDDAKPRDLLEGRAHFGPDLVKLEPRHAPDTIEQRRQLLELEQSFIEHFEYADTWGRALVTVKEGKVLAEVYRGLSGEAWKTLDLTGLLH